MPVGIVSQTPGTGSVVAAESVLLDDGSGATLSFDSGISPVLVLDFGQIVSGLLTIETLDSSSPTIRVAISESLQFLGPDSDLTWGEHRTTTWTPDPGPDSHETGQLAFRYARISLDSPGFVSIDTLRLYFTPFHGSAESYGGCFVSNDELVNQIWYAGAYTLELNTVAHSGGSWTIVDGAKRDRLTWTADLAVQARVEYATHGQSELVGYALADLASHQRDDGAIPPSPFGDYSLVLDDYCAWWVIALADYFAHTADIDFIESVYPNLSRQIDWFDTLPRSGGLITKQSDLEWAFTLKRTGAVTYLNVVYYRALRDAATIAQVLGHANDQARWSVRADALRDEINARLFDPTRGVYVDSDTDRAHIPLDANALAVAFDVAPPERRLDILQYLREHHWTPVGSVTVDPAYGSDVWHDRRIWPFASFLELLARFDARDDAAAWDLLRREWGHMLQSDPNATTWEWMTADGKIENGFVSLAHGWSAGATVALTEYALGVRPDSAGYASFVVDPRPGDVARAAGRVPTPHGPIELSWRSFAGGFSERVQVPEGTTARLAIPVNSPDALVLVNGEPAWQAGQSYVFAAHSDGGRIWLDLPPGDYTVLAVDRALYTPPTGNYLGAPFLDFWTASGGIPVFGYPMSAAVEELNPDKGEVYLVQYVERQRLEYHPENAGTPYEILLGRLGISDATRRGLIDSPPFAPLVGAPADSACLWFEATRHTLCGQFLAYWQSHGLEFGDPGVTARESLALFGLPISEPFLDPDSGYTVQYFERARFEHHPENAGTEWEILLGRLGADELAQAANGCCAATARR
jgi:hypothetical protein